MTIQQNLKTIDKLEGELFNTGVVYGIHQEKNYIIVEFSESINGLDGLRLESKNKIRALKQALKKIEKLNKLFN